MPFAFTIWISVDHLPQKMQRDANTPFGPSNYSRNRWNFIPHQTIARQA
ncbi:hypothetical protein SAMN05443635_104258 [Roseobacter denitrificans OCh 114]|nr:hypothetical protein SAMN05443635_104258 [Roseobacter denitrificans OCh 114]